MGLFYLSSITSHFLNALHWMVFDLFFYCMTLKTIALSNEISNALSNVASAYENNYSALESVSNGLKNVVPFFQFQFAFGTYLFRPSFRLSTRSKLKLRVFLAGHIVAMVTNSATKLTTTYSPMIVQFVDTIMLVSTSTGWL